MRMDLFLVLVVLVAVLGQSCRTTLRPTTRPAPVEVYVGDRTCNVYDFPAATDVPEGARNLGWVSVRTTGDDDETFLELRRKICELGGDALSQAAWVREAGEYEPTTLKANAWSLP